MIDFGFDKLALIGAVALIVIGPEKLPRVARTVGHMLGKAQRYVADVKAEVNRSIELDELQEDEDRVRGRGARRRAERAAARCNQRRGELEQSWSERPAPTARRSARTPARMSRWTPPPPDYKHPKKNWRLKRGAMPQWYKQRQGIRAKAQSGAARVARFRPPRRRPAP